MRCHITITNDCVPVLSLTAGNEVHEVRDVTDCTCVWLQNLCNGCIPTALAALDRMGWLRAYTFGAELFFLLEHTLPMPSACDMDSSETYCLATEWFLEHWWHGVSVDALADAESLAVRDHAACTRSIRSLPRNSKP